MLSKHEKLIKDTEYLIIRFDQYLENSDKSEAQLAKALGKSQTALNRWRHMKYKVSDDKLREFNSSVERYLSREAARRRSKPTEFVKTTIASQVTAVLHRCHIRGDMGVVIGRPGTGKTIAVNHYQGENPDVILLTAHIGWNVKSVLMSISKILGISSYGSSYVATDRIIENLSFSDRLIIIDEAQFLKLPCLEIVRTIHDLAGVGVVYIGQPELKRRMHGIDSEFYAQIYSRIGISLSLTNPEPADVELIARAKQITDRTVLNYLIKLSDDKYHSLRTISHLLDLANDVARNDGSDVSINLLKTLDSPIL